MQDYTLHCDLLSTKNKNQIRYAADQKENSKLLQFGLGNATAI